MKINEEEYEKGETKMNERLEKKISKWEGRIETISFYSYEEEKIIDYIEQFVDDLKEMDVLDKPEKAKVSKEDAKEIERYKENDWTLIHLLDDVGESAQHDELLARAWLDGYEIVEEQKYYVLGAEDSLILRRNTSREYVDPIAYAESGRLVKHVVDYNEEYLYQFTEQEIKDYDKRYWQFAVPVEEL